MDRNIELAILKSEDLLETGKDDLKANHLATVRFHRTGSSRND